jgi:hypothetical protein
LYDRPTAKGTVSPLQPSDVLILVIGPRLEGHSFIFLAIQTHLSCRFLLAVDSLGLRQSGSWSQIINQAQALTIFEGHRQPAPSRERRGFSFWGGTALLISCGLILGLEAMDG